MSELIDITGQKFGKWTVIKRVENTEDGQSRWLCRCECGFEMVQYGGYLRRIKDKITKCRHPHADLTGQRFGNLTVIGRDSIKRENGQSYFICKCDCGNTTSVRMADLKNGHTKSCGCQSSRSTMGQRSSKRTLNEYRVEDGVVYVELSNGGTMLCDESDWERFKDRTWIRNEKGYVYTSKTKDWQGCNLFHVAVIGKHDGMDIDHINRNKLDNRRCNLRVCSHHANSTNQSLSTRNTTGYKGIYRKHSGTKKWRAMIRINGKDIYLGDYENIEDAIQARKEAEDKYFKPLFDLDKEDKDDC